MIYLLTIKIQCVFTFILSQKKDHFIPPVCKVFLCFIVRWIWFSLKYFLIFLFLFFKKKFFLTVNEDSLFEKNKNQNQINRWIQVIFCRLPH